MGDVQTQQTTQRTTEQTTRATATQTRQGPAAARAMAPMSARVIDLRVDQMPRAIDWYDWGIRVGVATIFLVNALAAFITPEAFRSVLEDNLLASLLPVSLLGPMVVAAGINDVLLGAALLSGRHRRFVWAWTALWLAIVGGVKLLNLLA